MTLTYIAVGRKGHNRKGMSRDRFPLLLYDVTASAGNMSRDGNVLFRDVTARALHSNDQFAYVENTVPILLSECVLRAFSSNGSTRHIIYYVINIEKISALAILTPVHVMHRSPKWSHSYRLTL
jgi:hypothetical protein